MEAAPVRHVRVARTPVRRDLRAAVPETQRHTSCELYALHGELASGHAGWERLLWWRQTVADAIEQHHHALLARIVAVGGVATAGSGPSLVASTSERNLAAWIASYLKYFCEIS